MACDCERVKGAVKVLDRLPNKIFPYANCIGLTDTLGIYRKHHAPCGPFIKIRAADGESY